jgi:hypothetical protein
MDLVLYVGSPVYSFDLGVVVDGTIRPTAIMDTSSSWSGTKHNNNMMMMMVMATAPMS